MKRAGQLLVHPTHPFESGQGTLRFFGGGLLPVSPSVWSKPHSSKPHSSEAFSPCPLRGVRNRETMPTIYGTLLPLKHMLLLVSSECSQLGPVMWSLGRGARAICSSSLSSSPPPQSYVLQTWVTSLLHLSRSDLFYCGQTTSVLGKGQIWKHGEFHETDSRCGWKEKEKKKQTKRPGEGTCEGLDFCHSSISMWYWFLQY